MPANEGYSENRRVRRSERKPCRILGQYRLDVKRTLMASNDREGEFPYKRSLGDVSSSDLGGLARGTRGFRGRAKGYIPYGSIGEKVCCVWKR
jgi:hypothetical protein